MAPWWQRLHAALMPDYNRRAMAYWWLLVLAGALVLGACLRDVAALGAAAWLHIAVGMALAMGAGLFPVRVPGTKQSFVAGEIFIFLVLLLHGAPAAALVAAAEALVATLRTSRRWTSRLVSPAIAAIAMLATGSALQAVLAWAPGAGWGGAAPLLAATMACAAAYFLLNALLVGGVQRLKRNEAFFQLLDLFSVFRWVGLAYAGSASIATLLFVLYQQQGLAVLAVMVPLLAMLLVTLHFYFRQQESGEALREASASLAVREAAMAAREADAARRHLQELQASERRFHNAFTHASIGMALLDFDGRLLQANPAMAALLGRNEADLPQMYFQDLVLTEDRALFDEPLGLAERRDFESFARELRCQHHDGSTLWLDLHCSHFTEPGLDTPCLILQAQDISARRRAEAGLAHLAFHDPLTGLANRRRFVECLVGAVARFQADRSNPWAVMFIDFDRFKLVNDSLGHNAGDQLLKQMARRIQEKLRPGDTVARLGGDEFAILAERVEQERDAVVLAERLMESLRRPFVVGSPGNEVELIASASIGITFSALNYSSAEDVLRDADTAMYKAKSAGRARYALFDASLHTAVAQRLRLEGELRQAISQGQLAVEYQPVFELAAGGLPDKLSGFEALVRWRHPRNGTLQPAEFLPIAEESGLMLQLSDFVLHCACQQLRRWQLSSPELAELTMSINLSSHDLASPALVARVSRALVEAGLKPEHLTLEFTENILMSHLEGAVPMLTQLRSLGAHLAVDDFGTGYSSLSHLSKLPIDSLKIDRSFVSQLQPGSDDSAVVAAIVRLGASLRKAVVAEGIESQAQRDQLRELGCGFGQGFHLAHPLSEAAAGQWLQARRGPVH